MPPRFVCRGPVTASKKRERRGVGRYLFRGPGCACPQARCGGGGAGVRRGVPGPDRGVADGGDRMASEFAGAGPRAGGSARRPDGRQASDQQDAAAPRPGYGGHGHPWESQHHAAWLASIDLGDPLARLVLGEYLACHEVLLARRDRLDRLIAEQAQDEQWAALVGRLRCMRGIDTLTAVGPIAEIGDFTAFEHPKQLASFLGLVPAEQSCGEKRRQGSINQSRLKPRPQVADRSGLALPPPTRRFADPQAPPGRPAAGADRRCVARPATTLSALGAPRRAARQAPHDRRGRSRTRAVLFRLGDRPPNPTDPAFPFEMGGGRRRVTRDP
jgi:hypothetical protein